MIRTQATTADVDRSARTQTGVADAANVDGEKQAKVKISSSLSVEVSQRHMLVDLMETIGNNDVEERRQQSSNPLGVDGSKMLKLEDGGRSQRGRTAAMKMAAFWAS